MSSFNISSDAELMWNVLPAIALPSQSKFLTARDRNGNPMVFGIGTDSILRVAQENPQTRLRSLVDINIKLGLAPTTTTQGFDLFQTTDDKIFLCLSYTEENESRIMAVKPFHPEDVDFSDQSSSVSVFRTVRLDQMRIKDVTMVMSFTDSVESSTNLDRAHFLLPMLFFHRLFSITQTLTQTLRTSNITKFKTTLLSIRAISVCQSIPTPL